MKKIGEILKAARIEKKLNLEAISEKTKIRSDYLQAIENNKFSHLPSATFVKGFITNYAKAVSLKPNTALAIFRRDFDQNQKGKIIPRGLTNPIKNPSRIWNPKTTSIVIASITVLLVASYILKQVFNFTQAPPINLQSPGENELTSSIITVAGETSSDATLTINQKPVSLNVDGQFETTLDLSSGDHTITITARDREGKTRTLQRATTVQSN